MPEGRSAIMPPTEKSETLARSAPWGRLTGVPSTDFSRIRNLDLDRFTIARLIRILGRFDRRVDVQVAVTRKTFESV